VLRLLVQTYIGGNPTKEVNSYLPGIREWIFHNGTGSKFPQSAGRFQISRHQES
jgi:hypothetical protein